MINVGLLVLLTLVLTCAKSMAVDDSEVVDARTYNKWMSELSNWGRWGKGDEKGTINLITPEKRIEAAGLVKMGIAVSLGRDLNKEKSLRNRHPLHHEMIATGLKPSTTASLDSYTINYHGPTHSHLDALCHIFYDGKMYNGLPQTLVTEAGCQKQSINVFADGIFTRGVLIDIAYLKNIPYLEPGSAIMSSDLDAWAEKTRIEIEPGDAVLIRTGRWSAPSSDKPIWAGLHASAVSWLKEKDVSIVGTDYPGEQWPHNVQGISYPVHTLLFVAMGTQLLDNLDLDRLRGEAERLGRWDFLFTVAPLRVEGGTGSPVNPTAVF